MTGVSTKTVSRALNDEPHVSARVRQLVKEAAAKLDYHPNLNAQSLISRRSFLIGLTYERPSPSYVVDLQNGALDRMQSGRYRLVVLPFSRVSERPEELGKLLLRAGLDGVLLAPPACDQGELLDMLDRHGLAYARITPQHDLDRGTVITMDEVEAGHAIACHLLDLGHRRVGIILGDPSHAASSARLDGYRRAFADHGLTLDEKLIATGDFTYAVGYEAALDLLRRAPRPTAILAQNDDMAAAALAAARALGLSVPGDVSIAGFDDSEVSRTTWPQLTTVHQPVSAMAWDAADRLIARLDAGDDSPTAQQRYDHAHALLVRASTAPPA